MKKRVDISHKDLFSYLGNTIAEYGFTVIAVGKEKKHPSFFYTIGNQEKQLPELLLIGNFKPQDAHDILTRLTGMIKERKAGFAEGEKVSLGGKYPLLIYSAGETAKSEYTIQAGQFYGNEDYEVQQVIMPDPNGRYPWDAVCHKDFKVPVLRGF